MHRSVGFSIAPSRASANATGASAHPVLPGNADLRHRFRKPPASSPLAQSYRLLSPLALSAPASATPGRSISKADRRSPAPGPGTSLPPPGRGRVRTSSAENASASAKLPRSQRRDPPLPFRPDRLQSAPANPATPAAVAVSSGPLPVQKNHSWTTKFFFSE